VNLMVINQEQSEDVFDLKLNEWCESQIGNDEYGVFPLDESVIKKLKENEVFIVDRRNYCPTMGVKFYKNRTKDIFITMCKFCFQFFRTVLTLMSNNEIKLIN